MNTHTFTKFYLLVIILSVTSVQVNGQSLLNWIWSKQEEDTATVMSDGVPLVNIPYEMLTEDEKFLKEAAKLVTDIQISSPLEICQHKVVMKIKTSCGSMTEEELAKLSVNLLNCQSATEGRRVFPCSEEMSIKQCTSNMDADTWNAYHLMSNRARAVCYASRSQEFRALTELTVNKLMSSAHAQIQTLESLKESQDRLEEQTVTAQKIVESNIQDLTNEKALIRAGHTQLAEMTEDIKKKLEKASHDLLVQAEERGHNQEEILKDLENIKIQAQLLWEKIESSTNRIIQQNHDAATQYEETLIKLEKINKTIVFISDLTNTMRDEIDKKLGWILEYIGTTGENLDKIYRITLHVVYLLGAMVVSAFLQAPFLTRSAILGIVPVNLASYLKHGLNACLDFVSITVLILLITAMHYLMNGIQYLMRARNEKTEEVGKPQQTAYTNGHAAFNGNASEKMYSDIEKTLLKPSSIDQLFNIVANLCKGGIQQIYQSIENLKVIFQSIMSWTWQKVDPIEELSCSYVATKKYERIASGRRYPSISDDDSEYSDSRDSGKFVISDDNSLTGTVLRRKATGGNVSPLTAFFKGNRGPALRQPSVARTIIDPIKPVSSRSATPVSRPLCGAVTRSGNPCRLLASKGQTYCHRHISGSPGIGEL